MAGKICWPFWAQTVTKEKKKINPVSAVFRARGFKKIIDTRDLKMWKIPNRVQKYDRNITKH
jgi:hypothetical protein